MENLSIEKFSPKKAELATLAKQYQSLEIKGINDKDGYLAVDEARKDLKSKRVEIKKTGKELRAEALKYQKDVILLENELVDIIEPLEKELLDKQDVIKQEKLIVEREILLPNRKTELAKIDINISDDELLLMSPTDFTTFLNLKKEEYYEEKERIAQEREDKIEAANAKLKYDKDIEAAKKQERINNIKEADEDKARLIKDMEEKAKIEKQDLINEQKRKDDQRIEDERLEKERIANEKERIANEKKELQSKKKYQKWLEDSGWTEKDSNNFSFQRSETEVFMFKKCATYKI